MNLTSLKDVDEQLCKQINTLNIALIILPPRKEIQQLPYFFLGLLYENYILSIWLFQYVPLFLGLQITRSMRNLNHLIQTNEFEKESFYIN